jgi:NAD-dependent deacetylase
VVWFGEPLDAVAIETAIARVEEAEVIIVVGTSSVVYPVAALPQIARRRGARIVEVNVEDTPLTGVADAVLRGTAGQLLPALGGAP